jgi:hypothetical protein
MSVASLVESEGFKAFSSKVEKMGSFVLIIGLFNRTLYAYFSTQ